MPNVRFKSSYLFELLDLAELAGMSPAQVKLCLENGTSLTDIRKFLASYAELRQRPAEFVLQ
jgi:hypothetical protein